MKLFENLLLFIFRVKYNSKKFRTFKSYVINFYSEYDNEFTFNSYRITKCRLYNLPKKIVVEIHTLSPGMIIGKGGSTYDRFKSFIEKKYSKPVKIKLEEANPFK